MGDFTGRNNKRSILLNLKAADKVEALKEFNKLSIMVAERGRKSKDSLLPIILSHRHKTEGSHMISLLDESPRLKDSKELLLPLIENSSSRHSIWEKSTFKANYIDASIDFDDDASGTSRNKNTLGKQYLGLILMNSVREKLRAKHEAIERQKKKKFKPVKRFTLSVEGTI